MTPTPDTRQTRTKRARVARHLVALATATATALLITGGAYAAAENPNITAKDDTGASTGKYGRSAAASGSGYAVAEDGRLDVPASRGVLANDTGSGRLTAKLYKATSHGYLTLRRDGSFTYLPFANYYGPDAFRYRACNSAGCSKPATAYITVRPVNDAPVARDNLLSVSEDGVLSLANPGVISNDTDIDDSLAGLSVNVLENVSYGQLALSSAGGLSYRPASNFSGTDRFTYRLYDGAASDTATVNISVAAVQDPPVARRDVFWTRPNTSKLVVRPGVLRNDSDPDSDNLSVLGHSQPKHARVTVYATGAVKIVPDKGYRGRTEFQYAITDGHGNRREASVLVNIGV